MRVSFLMAAWRPQRDWLLGAVDSILRQRGCELELIVVDDGSPEPVEDLLAAVTDPRLRVVRIAHGGEVAARNAGIAAADGDFLRFVDADDLYDLDSTARLLAMAAARPGAIPYGATVFCDEQLRPVWTMRSRLEGWVAEECLLGRFSVRVPSMLFPRAVVDATGTWDGGFEGVNHDLDFLLRALDHAPVAASPEPATYYRKHFAGATRDFSTGERGRWRVVQRYFDRHPEQRGTRLERRAEARIYAYEARVRLVRGRPAAAARRLARAVALDPRSLTWELAHGLPALAGRMRRLIAPRSPVGRPSKRGGVGSIERP